MSRAIPSQAPLWDAAAAPDQPTHSRPTEAAYWRGSVASRNRSRDEQRQLGQFMTPPAIARFIARGIVEHLAWHDGVLRMLDPAAGSGVLAAALVEAVVALQNRPVRIELLLCDIDAEMAPLLSRCADELKKHCARHGVALDVHLQQGDFLLGRLALDGQGVIDAVIANPPYFKLGRTDPRAQAHSTGVHGQPNIYALFMTACAALLRPGGALGFITPRSWTNGAYFRATREQLRRKISINALHLFDSREAHFEGDAVLQEALITWGTAGVAQGDISVSLSHGPHDLDAANAVTHAATRILGPDASSPIVLPSPSRQDPLAHWTQRLSDLGLKVVTGPVVGFRAASQLRRQDSPTTVPMLWMPHVRRGSIEWPRNHSAEHIERNAESEWMLLPNEPMVLLRRFSPKEDVRRVTAAAYLGDLPGECIGCENHLNVIRGAHEPMSQAAARGLAAWLNSAEVDEHLRQRLGSTQVNAVELRALPMPGLVALNWLGLRLRERPSLDEIDALVATLRDPASPAAQAA